MRGGARGLRKPRLHQSYSSKASRNARERLLKMGFLCLPTILGCFPPSCDFSLPVPVGFLTFVICFSFAFSSTGHTSGNVPRPTQEPEASLLRDARREAGQGERMASPSGRRPVGEGWGSWRMGGEAKSEEDPRPRLREVACPYGRQEAAGTKSDQATVFPG